MSIVGAHEANFGFNMQQPQLSAEQRGGASMKRRCRGLLLQTAWFGKLGARINWYVVYWSVKAPTSV